MSEKRTEVIAVRVTKDEKIAIRVAAAQADMLMAEYVRSVVLDEWYEERLNQEKREPAGE